MQPAESTANQQQGQAQAQVAQPHVEVRASVRGSGRWPPGGGQVLLLKPQSDGHEWPVTQACVT